MTTARRHPGEPPRRHRGVCVVALFNAAKDTMVSRRQFTAEDHGFEPRRCACFNAEQPGHHSLSNHARRVGQNAAATFNANRAPVSPIGDQERFSRGRRPLTTPRLAGHRSMNTGCARGLQCFQPILFYGKCPFLARGKGARANSFRTEQPNKEVIDHPCPKPLSWMEWAVNRASWSGETVLDPFLGSGTTGIACSTQGRSFIGIEREPKYFDIACRRIEDAQRQQRMFA